MAFAVIRAAKQKGGGVAASGKHNDRARETPNAEKEKEKENRVLVGDERDVKTIVSEFIDKHGGKPRSDSVEAIELLLTASREFFTDGKEEILPERVEAFVEKGMKFIDKNANFGICAKAVLHMDERTPHIHAHMVPIDPNGKLNCKYYMGGREKLVALQDRYHETMKPLGLERGEHGSRATHTEIKKFYGAITRDHVLQIDIQRLPDPPTLILTKDSVKKYKKSLVIEIQRQTAEPLKTLHHQSMLAREERSRRETFERVSEAKLTAAENGRAEAERNRAVAERIAQQEQARIQQLLAVIKDVATERNLFQTKTKDRERELAAERQKTQEQRARVTDIRMASVMERFGYGAEKYQDRFVYRDGEGKVSAQVLNDNTFRDRRGDVICSNSIDLVMCLERFKERTITDKDALLWLSKSFGEERATAAWVARTEQTTTTFLKEIREQEREQQKVTEQEREPATRAQEPAPDRGPIRERRTEREEHIHVR